MSSTNRIRCSGKTPRDLQGTRKENIQIENPPDIGEVKRFWQNILEQEVKHNEDAQWINDQEGRTAAIPDGVEGPHS